MYKPLILRSLRFGTVASIGLTLLILGIGFCTGDLQAMINKASLSDVWTILALGLVTGMYHSVGQKAAKDDAKKGKPLTISQALGMVAFVAVLFFALLSAWDVFYFGRNLSSEVLPNSIGGVIVGICTFFGYYGAIRRARKAQNQPK